MILVKLVSSSSLDKPPECTQNVSKYIVNTAKKFSEENPWSRETAQNHNEIKPNPKMSSLKFIDYMNISSLSAISFMNASLAYLNSTNGSTASYPSAVNLTTGNGSMLLEMASPPSAASALPALFSLNGTALDFGLGGVGAGPGGSYPAPNYSFPFHNFVQKEFIFDRTDVRVIFITLYSLVFCCCFFGKFIFWLN